MRLGARTDPAASGAISASAARSPRSTRPGTPGTRPTTRRRAPGSPARPRVAPPPRAAPRGSGTHAGGEPPGCRRSGTVSLVRLSWDGVYTTSGDRHPCGTSTAEGTAPPRARPAATLHHRRAHARRSPSPAPVRRAECTVDPPLHVDALVHGAQLTAAFECHGKIPENTTLRSGASAGVETRHRERFSRDSTHSFFDILGRS